MSVPILKIGNKLPAYVHLMDLVGWEFDCSNYPMYPMQEFHVDGKIKQYIAGYTVKQLNKKVPRKQLNKRKKYANT